MTVISFPDKTDLASSSAEIHCLQLPVAPQTNNGIRFATAGLSTCLTPLESVEWIRELIKGGKEIRSIEIDGPGDALAAPQTLFEILELLNSNFPEIEIGLNTIGLGAEDLAEKLAEYDVKWITLDVQGIEPAMLQKIYAWVRPGKKTIPITRAADLLAHGQKVAIRAFTQAGISVNVRTTVYQGINDKYIKTIAREMAALGAGSIDVRPCVIEDQGEEDVTVACSAEMLAHARKQAEVYLKLAKNTVDSIPPPSIITAGKQSGLLPKPSRERPNVAVASTNGMDVDLHLGQTESVLIYGPREDGLACLLKARHAPAAGSGDQRWQTLARGCLHDCFCILVANAGENPKKILGDHGIKVIVTEDNIEGMVDVLYGGGKKKCRK